MRLSTYILDDGNGGEKVAWSRVTNCQSDDPGWAVKEIVATQALNPRGRIIFPGPGFIPRLPA